MIKKFLLIILFINFYTFTFAAESKIEIPKYDWSWKGFLELMTDQPLKEVLRYIKKSVLVAIL